MGCYWSTNYHCDQHIVVRNGAIGAFEDAVREYGLNECHEKFSWDDLGDGTSLYAGDTFVEGFGSYSASHIIQRKIMSLAEPGSYVDVYYEEEASYARLYPNGEKWDDGAPDFGKQFSHEDSQGHAVVEKIDRNVIVKRKDDYAVGHLYDEETGSWAWGHYGFATLADARICLLALCLEDLGSPIEEPELTGGEEDALRAAVTFFAENEQYGDDWGAEIEALNGVLDRFARK